MKLLILLALPISILSQPPNFSGKPPLAPPGLGLPCWPPPCVPIGDLLLPAMILTAIVLAVNKLDNKYNNK